MKQEKNKRKLLSFPVVFGAIVLIGLGVVSWRDSLKYAVRGEDNRPEVDFTWQPLGRVDLREMVGRVTLKDDWALDFSTFRIYVVELDKELAITRPDLVGREYEDRVSFAMFANNYDLLRRGKMTLEISVSDDRGQETKITREVKLKQDVQLPQLIFE